MRKKHVVTVAVSVAVGSTVFFASGMEAKAAEVDETVATVSESIIEESNSESEIATGFSLDESTLTQTETSVEENTSNDVFESQPEETVNADIEEEIPDGYEDIGESEENESDPEDDSLTETDSSENSGIEASSDDDNVLTTDDESLNNEESETLSEEKQSDSEEETNPLLEATYHYDYAYNTLKYASVGGVLSDSIVNAAQSYIRSMEGTYSSVVKNDNGALSIGMIQWHGDNALTLLRIITSMDANTSLNILGSSLYNAVTYSGTSWSSKVLNDDEANRIAQLLSTDNGKTAQDNLSRSYMVDYVNRGVEKGIANAAAMVYYADLQNQWGVYGALKHADYAYNLVGDWSKVTLNELHIGSLCYSSNYSSRRMATYKYASSLGWTYCLDTDYQIPYNYDESNASANQWLQTALNAYQNAGLAVDGNYSDQMRTAVRTFQTNAGIEVDGQAGQDTALHLVRALYLTLAKTGQGGTYLPLQGQAVNREEIQAYVTRLYQVCLDREPDSVGLNNWVNQLATRSQTGSQVAYGFVFSPEFKSKNLCNNDYVEYLYKAIMGRGSDSAGKANWVGQLTSGSTREAVFNGFIGSQEFSQLCSSYGVTVGTAISIPEYGTVPTGSCSKCGAVDGVTAFVTRFYNVCLNRTPDSEGLKNWTNQLWNHTNSGSGVAYGFIFSPEFVGKNLNNADFVEALYRTFLGRGSDAPGKADWVNKLNQGYSRKQIFDGFVGSQEFMGICNSYGIVR